MDQNTKPMKTPRKNFNGCYQLVDGCIDGNLSLRWAKNKKDATVYSIFSENLVVFSLGEVPLDKAIENWAIYPKSQPRWTYNLEKN